MTDPGPAASDAPRQRWFTLLEGLRSYAASYTEVTHHLARWLGVHSADANAFAEILYAEDQGEPLSPARLAARISLSSGATTSLLNRLERANLVARSREHTDRRFVTLRSVPSVTARSWSFFQPLAERVDGALAEFSDDDLETARRVVARVNEAVAATIAEFQTADA
ncbi:MarR family winged helix-turn-helix transcriptional regulator [Jatrophihabitans sp. YIM 134969]